MTFELVVFSGTVFFNSLNMRLTLALMLISSILYVLIFKRKFKINLRIKKKSSFNYLLLYCLWIILNISVFNRDIQSNLFVSQIMYAIFAYITISNIPFDKFKFVLLRIVSVLAGVSIILFLLYELNLLKYQTMYVNTTSYNYFCFHFFDNRNSGIHRLMGIFWEPGVYEIVLNFTLLICSKDIMNKTLAKKDKIGVFIIILALILTRSTSGYIVGFILFISMLFYGKIIPNKKVLIPILILILPLLTLAVYNTNVVKGKFEEENGNYSFTQRSLDNLGMLQMFLEKPLTGYGLETSSYNKSIIRNNVTVACNGILSMLSKLGLPIFIVLLYFMYQAIIKLKLGLPVLLSFFLILLLHTGENYLPLPLSYIFIFNFKKVLSNEK